MVKIIDGRKIAGEREGVLKERVGEFVSKHRRRPKLTAVMITDDPSSNLYLKLKRASAERIGIEFTVSEITGYRLPLTDYLAADGIFLQHPPRFDKKKWTEIADQIPVEKDVDGLSADSLNLIKRGRPLFLPATVKAVGYCLLSAFDSPGIEQFNDLSIYLKSKRIVVLGRSPIIGIPLYWWLKNFSSQIDIFDSATQNISHCTQEADILISAIDHPGYITSKMVKKGVIVIDIGSPAGDVDFDQVSPKSAAITPVPGGVGPLTVVSLMENVLQLAHLAEPESS